MSDSLSIIFGKIRRILYYLPFYWFDGILLRALSKVKGDTLLDAGCGTGRSFLLHLKDKFFLIGVDLNLLSLNEAKLRDVYSDCILADVRIMPFRQKGVDVVLCLEVMEHLFKEEGNKLINDLEDLSRRFIAISTPNGLVCEESSNVLQVHRSGWYPEDFRIRGYNVRGYGLRCLYVSRNMRASGIRRMIALAFSISWHFLVWLNPSIALDILAIKTFSDNRCLS